MYAPMKKHHQLPKSACNSASCSKALLSKDARNWTQTKEIGQKKKEWPHKFEEWRSGNGKQKCTVLMKDKCPRKTKMEDPKQMMTNQLQEHESTLGQRAIKKRCNHAESRQCKAKKRPLMKKSHALDDQTNARSKKSSWRHFPPPKGGEWGLQQTETSRPIQKGRVLQVQSQKRPKRAEAWQASEARQGAVGCCHLRG